MKVYQVEFSKVSITPIKDRLYSLTDDVKCVIKTDTGCLYYHIKAGFEFDSRSGGKFVDNIIPNLGSQNELICWLIHDCNFFGLRPFHESNEILYLMLRKCAKYGWWKAKSVYWSVDSFGESHYGYDESNADDVANRNHIHFEYCDGERGFMLSQAIAFSNDVTKLNDLSNSSIKYREQWNDIHT